VHCKNKKKDAPTVVFELVVLHIIAVLHVSDMFWGCYSASLIVKFDKAVHEIMDGRYSNLPFELSDIDGDKIVEHGVSYSDVLISFIHYAVLNIC
jgi:hypothetical protein